MYIYEMAVVEGNTHSIPSATQSHKYILLGIEWRAFIINRIYKTV